MNNIICIPFAYDEKKQSGVNIHGNERLQVYLKNACVACVSAKYYNKDCRVMIATNLTENHFPEELRTILQNHQIEIKTIPFDRIL